MAVRGFRGNDGVSCVAETKQTFPWSGIFNMRYAVISCWCLPGMVDGIRGEIPGYPLETCDSVTQR